MGSRELAKLSLIYADGVSKVKARSRGWGILAGNGGGGTAFGKVVTKGAIQTELSQKVSPPRKRSYWRIFRWGLVTLFVLVFSVGYTDTFVLRGRNFALQFAWFVYPYLCVLVFMLCFALWHNRSVFPKRFRLWDRSFMCRRCGHIVQLAEPRDVADQALLREARP